MFEQGDRPDLLTGRPSIGAVYHRRQLLAASSGR